MRTEEEVKEAIKDYARISPAEFRKKYRLDSKNYRLDPMRETVGFVKALRWVLELV